VDKAKRRKKRPPGGREIKRLIPEEKGVPSIFSRRYGFIALILAVSFGVYLNALFNGFVYDDEVLLLQNPLMRDARYIPKIFLSDMWAFHFTGGGNYYRPMFHIFYMSDYYIFGLRPWGFHLTKILLHMGSSLLVFLMASTIISRYGGRNTKTYNEYVPFAAALLFATHPIHTEAVLGITEVSLAFFYFLSFYLYVKADDVWGKFSIVSLLFFFLAALSKETALTLPILLFAYDYSFKRDSVLYPTPETFYLLLKRYLPYLVVAGIYFILRTYAVGGFAPVKIHAELSGYEYFINVFPLFAQYLGKMILPINLNAAYVFYPISSLLEWKGIMAVAVTLGFIFTLYLARDRNRVVFFSLLLVVIPLLPAFYIPALGEHTFAERYLYLPSTGFVIIASMGLCGIASLDALRDRAMPIMLSVVLVITALYSAGTIKRNPVWKDDLTLWSDTVKKSPDGFIPHYNLGLAHSKKGFTDKAIENYKKAIILKPHFADAHNNLGLSYLEKGLHDTAIQEFKMALHLKPDHAEAHNNLGAAYYNLGRTDEAIEESKEALRLKPDYVDAHFNLGLAYRKLGRTDEAVKEYKLALSLNPNHVGAHYNLGNSYSEQGWIDKAIVEYKEAIMLNPDYADAHYNLGLAYMKKGRMDEAIGEYKLALKLEPDYVKVHRIDEAIGEYKEALRLTPDYADAHNNLGTAYHSQNRIDEAIEEYKEALRLKPDYVDAHFNLGTAYAMQGRMDEAIEEYKSAIRLKPDLADAHFNLGLAYKRKGLRNEAIKEFEETLKISPDYQKARKALETLSEQ
jgi:tetratricopeptide (TPR) repeat protein